MGYRNYIGTFDNVKHNAIKDMTLAELKKWYTTATGKTVDGEYDPSIRPYDIANKRYELGKYCELEFLTPEETRVFTHDECEQYFNEEDELKIIGKKGFEAIIEDYRQKISKHFNDLVAQIDREEPADEIDIKLGLVPSIDKHIKDKAKEWGENCDKYKLFPYNLSLQSENVVGSWKYEYAIFDLVRLYKSIDWENEQVLIMGW